MRRRMWWRIRLPAVRPHKINALRVERSLEPGVVGRQISNLFGRETIEHSIGPMANCDSTTVVVRIALDDVGQTGITLVGSKKARTFLNDAVPSKERL